MRKERRTASMSVQRAYRSLMESSKQDPIMENTCREWIWEYILTHCSSMPLIRALMEAYTIPNSSLRLKRMLLLKSLSFDLLEDRFSERTIETVSCIMDVDNAQGIRDEFTCDILGYGPIPHERCYTMKDLLMALKLEYTIQHLREESDNWPQFYEALENHWQEYAPDTDDPDDAYFNRYMELRKELQGIRKMPEHRHALLDKCKRLTAKRMLERYIEHAWEKLGTTFLDNVAQNLLKGTYVPDTLPERTITNIISKDKANSLANDGSLKQKQKKMRGLVNKKEADHQQAKSLFLSGQTNSKKINQRESPEKGMSDLPGVVKRLECQKQLIEPDKGMNKALDIDWLRPENPTVEAFHEKFSTGAIGKASEIELLGPENLPAQAGYNLRRKVKLSHTQEQQLSYYNTTSSPEAGPRVSKLMSSTAESSRATGANKMMEDDNIGKVPPRVEENVTHEEFVEPIPLEEGNEQRHVLSKFNSNEEEPSYLSPPPWAGEDSPGVHTGFSARRSKRRKVVSNDTTGPRRDNTVLDTPVVVKAQSELKEKQADLNAVVTDPLPEALKIAEEVRNEIPHANLGEDTLHVNGDDGGTLPSKNTGSTALRRLPPCIVGSGSVQVDVEKQTRISLMDRNPTAQTFKWDTSEEIAESSEDKSPSLSRQVRLPKLQRRQSLSKPGLVSTRNAPRRKFRRWTQEEENILKKEVARYGKGHWKHILDKHKDVFESRTEVDLKDKWRNIEKRDGLV